jgi:hypothetical protein
MKHDENATAARIGMEFVFVVAVFWALLAIYCMGG